MTPASPPTPGSDSGSVPEAAPILNQNAMGGGDERDVTLGYSLSINGSAYPVQDAWIGESLLYVLRERLGLPGSKNACEQGECGSCSVVLDGMLVCSCLVLAADAVGSEVATIEGLSAGGNLSDVQQAFLDTGAVQCGFCTTGLVMSVHDMLDKNPAPTDLETREAISGNLCRCTGYGRIFEAIDLVVTRRSISSAGATS